MDRSQNCYVAFLDIMGFANFVNNTNSANVLEYLNNLVNIANRLNLPSLNLNVSIFSDTIAISAPVIDDATNGLAGYYNFLAYINTILMVNITEPKLGLLPLRGAVTKGEFYTNNKDILFGKAWVEAYNLEKNHACFPRVVVRPEDVTPEKAKTATNNINNLFINVGLDKKVPRTLKVFDGQSQPLRRDNDGVLHCNYFSSLWLHGKGWSPNTPAWVLAHRNYAVKKLEEYKDSPSICEKYVWMKDYHNWFCGGHNELHGFVIKDTVATPS